MDVKKNRTIHLIINANKPKVVNVPDVVGVSLRQAKSELERSGLFVGEIKYRPDMARNNVLEQRYKGNIINPGKSIKEGENIDLILGDGYKSMFTNTPNLKGLHLRDVKKQLPLSYLNLGKTYYNPSIKTFKDSIKAVVVKQYPKENVRTNMGSDIRIWLGLNNNKE